MKTEEPKILHLPKYPARQGGMDALLRLHEKRGETVLGLLKLGKLPSIGFNTTIPFRWQKSALKKLGEISAKHNVSLYYNCWGADLFSPYDNAVKRIGYLHNHFPNFEKYIQHFGPHLDGFMTVNPATTARVRELLKRTHPVGNIQTVPLPITPPAPMPVAEKENVIGLIGRINYEQKRYDRLPEFARLLANEHPEMRIEVLGDGPKKKEIIKETKHFKNVTILEWKTGKDYWETLARWKYVLFLSDYEGLPISLLEAIHAGCNAIYPDFHDGHSQELPLRLYPPGKVQSAIKCIHTGARTRTDGTSQQAPHRNSDYLTQVINKSAKMEALHKCQTFPTFHENTITYNRFYRALIS